MLSEVKTTPALHQTHRYTNSVKSAICGVSSVFDCTAANNIAINKPRNTVSLSITE